MQALNVSFFFSCSKLISLHWLSKGRGVACFGNFDGIHIGHQKIIQKLELMSKRMKQNLLDTALAAGASSSHIGGGLSIIDITATLYGGIMNVTLNHIIMYRIAQRILRISGSISIPKLRSDVIFASLACMTDSTQSLNLSPVSV